MDWNREEWTLAIAIFSVLLTLLTTVLPPLYRRYWVRPKLRIHKAGFLQIHFGPYGPGIGAVGAIQAVNSRQFMTSLEAVITHERTGARFQFVWRVLFPDAFTRDPGKPPIKDLPAGVMISPQQAFRFNAFFSDPEVEYGLIREIQDEIRVQWAQVIGKVISDVHAESPEALAELVVDADRTRKTMFAGFMQSEAFSKARERLDSSFIWQPGFHRITFRAWTAEPDASFEDAWRFELSEDCVRRLRHNSDVALAEMVGLGLPDFLWSGCTVDYLPR